MKKIVTFAVCAAFALSSLAGVAQTDTKAKKEEPKKEASAKKEEPKKDDSKKEGKKEKPAKKEEAKTADKK